ncbi:ABC transporter permease [Pseudomaricurvus sp. HS19]|uniref:ABC transporter permease n=1 Tax=Pseudomaricurvus sp. HS19 TaxID=2692626 RepID=UPI00136AF6BF|nr:ABC transporter permease [Pseudomaricurvus sp. HS19]MYM63967.1 ABC transporter permease [Pseudomaricurvus sp. HS19]
MSATGFLIRKELQLLGRDPHGLALLFLMPAVFILVMTFALQNQYSLNTDTRLDYLLLDRDQSEASARFVEGLGEVGTFNRLQDSGDEEALRARAQADDAKFLLIINAGFAEQLAAQQTAVELLFAPGTSPIFTGVVESQVSFLLKRLSLELSYGELLESADDIRQLINNNDLYSASSLFEGEQQYPTSVQQNVPAWLLFAMFFIAIPLSTTFISERQQGTLTRLRSQGIGRGQLLAGKLIPYFGINLLQVVMLFLIGLYLVPWLGGDQLTLGQHPWALLVIALAASLAAVCYALLVAQLAGTVEQATMFAAVCNIIMAALGGVMVPRFIMPATMQQLSDLSPMAWGLEGFFDILLRGGDVIAVLPEAGKLLLFAATMVALATLIERRRA